MPQLAISSFVTTTSLLRSHAEAPLGPLLPNGRGMNREQQEQS